MFGCVGEDYSTLERIHATGGIAPDQTWPENLKHIEAAVGLADKLGLKLVTFHLGFLPEQSDPNFGKMLERLTTVADLFAQRNIEVGLETGQESAEDLAAVLRRANRPNLGVNFDPANIILYGRDNVLGALRVLQPWLRQVHIKDAVRTKTPGTWGTEVVVGTGEVDWPAFFATLEEGNFVGHAVIEREAGDNRVGDIIAAKQVLSK
jgi:sugar phosphate isomerase/epimerase